MATPSLPIFPGWCTRTTTLTTLFQRRATSPQTQSRQCSSSDQNRWWTFTIRRTRLGCLGLLLGQVLTQCVVDASCDIQSNSRFLVTFEPLGMLYATWAYEGEGVNPYSQLSTRPGEFPWFQLVRWVRFCNRNGSHNANFWGWQYPTVSATTSVAGTRKWFVWSDVVNGQMVFCSNSDVECIFIWDFQPSFLASILAVR